MTADMNDAKIARLTRELQRLRNEAGRVERRLAQALLRRRGDSAEQSLAAARGKLGGLRGGPARARKLTPARRREIAQTAARARWAKRAETGGA